MAEKIVEKEICENCGADVRPDTLFCYNCGSAVTPIESNGNNTNYPTVKDKILEEERTTQIGSEKNLTISKEEKLQTAAALQQKNKSAQKKTIEVVWDEPESAPNVWFLVVAFLLTIFAVGIFVTMLYIR